MKMTLKTSDLTRIAMIAALYAVITLLGFGYSFGAVQFRVSEMLTLLPVFTANAVPGLSLGCALANFIGFATGANPLGLLDALVGTSATLIAAVLTRLFAKSSSRTLRYILCPLPPVIINAVIIGLELVFVFGPPNLNGFIINAGSVLIGQAVVCYTLGLILMIALEKNDLYKKIFFTSGQ